jgi:hypothetical protein
LSIRKLSDADTLAIVFDQDVRRFAGDDIAVALSGATEEHTASREVMPLEDGLVGRDVRAGPVGAEIGNLCALLMPVPKLLDDLTTSWGSLVRAQYRPYIPLQNGYTRCLSC